MKAILNRLFVKVYLTIIGSLLLVVVVSAIIWRNGPEMETARDAFEMASGVVMAALADPGATTVPAHTLFDIVRKLPEGSQVELIAAEGRMQVNAGRARFTLATLPRDDDKAMPPENKGDPLTPAEIAVVKKWIVDGADFGGWEGNLTGKPAPAETAAKAPPKERERDVLYKKLAEGLAPAASDALKKAQAAGPLAQHE